MRGKTYTFSFDIMAMRRESTSATHRVDLSQRLSSYQLACLCCL